MFFVWKRALLFPQLATVEKRALARFGKPQYFQRPLLLPVSTQYHRINCLIMSLLTR